MIFNANMTSKHLDSKLPFNRVWLTFDDGPHLRNTGTILDALGERGISAIFFVLGRRARHARRIVLRRIRDEGHWIGNHAFSHRDLTTLSEVEVRREITSTESAIAEFLGPGKLFRPPYGASNAMVDRVVGELGYRKILWDIDTLDWDARYQPFHWVRHAVDQIRRRERSVILAHDIHRTTADHVADLIESIERNGRVIFEGGGALCIEADRAIERGQRASLP